MKSSFVAVDLGLALIPFAIAAVSAQVLDSASDEPIVDERGQGRRAPCFGVLVPPDIVERVIQGSDATCRNAKSPNDCEDVSHYHCLARSLESCVRCSELVPLWMAATLYSIYNFGGPAKPFSDDDAFSPLYADEMATPVDCVLPFFN